MKSKPIPIKSNQTGLVAIVVTLMIMMVVTLITLTFTKIIRREQRQSLDRQLNTQAFYAAESGINDAVEAINGGYNSAKPGCAPLVAGAGIPVSLTNNDVDIANNVEYTCLTIDPEPYSLEYDDIDTAQSTIIPVKAGSDISSITIAWQDKGGSTNYNCGTLATSDAFPVSTAPACGTGVLRLDIVPASGSVTRSGLLAESRTIFLIPSSTGGDNIYTLGASGDKDQVACSSSSARNACEVKIDGLKANTSAFYLHARSIYVSSSLTVTAKDSLNNPLKLMGVQAIVDSTGKANDVLRRILVRVPLGGGTSIVPDFAIQSTDTICKRLKITGATAEFEDPAIAGVDISSCSP